MLVKVSMFTNLLNLRDGLESLYREGWLVKVMTVDRYDHYTVVLEKAL